MEASGDTLTLILRALKFSAEKHRHQRRKGSDASPYINHLIDVADILFRIGGVTDAQTLAAAILHDTIEDTATTPAELETNFGAQVRVLVQEVSDDKSEAKVLRKQRQIDSAPGKSPRAKQIVLADKISNVRDISESPPAGWPLERREEYLDWSEKVVAGVRGSNPALEELYDKTLAQARAKLNEERGQGKGVRDQGSGVRARD